MSLTDQQRIETAADNCEVLRARLAKYEDAEGNPKAQPSVVVLPERWSVPRPIWKDACQPYGDPLNKSDIEAAGKFNLALDEVARLNSSPISAGDESAAVACCAACGSDRATLSAPIHGEQVRVVPVEPTDAMLEAGDKYIGTPATYKSMLSACPSPAITKDFSQFLSAVMDAAGLIRHGRQSKELSEYLGMKCMEYRGAALSAPIHGEQVRGQPKQLAAVKVSLRMLESGRGVAKLEAWDLSQLKPGMNSLYATPSAGSQEQG